LPRIANTTIGGVDVSSRFFTGSGCGRSNSAMTIEKMLQAHERKVIDAEPELGSG
jgi:hypothetical protein